MKRLTCILLVLLLLLCGCSVEKAENPYRLISQTHTSYYGEQEITWNHSVTYNDQGWVAFSVDNRGNSTEYEYDAFGNIIRSVNYGSDGTAITTENVLTLDDQHRILQMEVYIDGVLSSTQEYAYDRYGNKIQINIDRVIKDQDNIQSWVTRKYDRHGNLLREETAWSSGNSNYTIYEYKDGQLVRSETYNTDHEIESWTDVVYQSNGLEIKSRYQADGTLIQKGVVTRDEYGNPLRSESYYGEGFPTGNDDQIDHLTTYTYERILE